MTFITNTITNANPGPALYAAIETAMLADGWTLVDTVVIGSNTHKVLKSAAAGNTQGLDWYLDINYPTTGITGGIRFTPFEGYNATTHVATNGPYITNGTTIDATTYSRFGTTASALETNWANAASSSMSMALTTSAFTYRISVTRNRIVGNLDNTPAAIFYGGFFTPSSSHASWSGSALFPLIVGVFNSGITSSYSASNPGVSLTRLPKLSGLSGNGWQYHVFVFTITNNVGGSPEGQIGVSPSPFTGRSTVKPLQVVASNGTYTSGSPGSTGGWVLDEIGTIDDISIGFASSTAVRGDNFSDGTNTWYATAPASNPYSTLFFKGV